MKPDKALVIGMLIDTYLPIIGGAEIHVLELSRALARNGCQVKICTAVPDEKTSTGNEFEVTRIACLSGGHWRAFLSIIKALPSLGRFIRQVDIIHCHYSFLMAMLGTLYGKITGKPSVVTLHGLGTLDSSVNKSALRKLYRYVSLRLADRVIATSDEMKAVALRFTSENKIVVIPNGVNTSIFTPVVRQENKSPVVLTMRRLARKNGVQYLVEAAPKVIAQIPQVQFWVAGEGKLEGTIHQRVEALNLQDNFRFIGMVPHHKTQEFYQAADVVVFPSSAESTSLACLEAMACEKAIIASNLYAYQDMLGKDNERGVLVPLFDRLESDYDAPLTLPQERIDAFSEAILSLIRDSGLGDQMGKRARLFVVDHYDWQKIAKDTAAVYSAGRDK